MDDFNLERLNNIRKADQYRFHSLLNLDRVKDVKGFPIKETLGEASEQLRRFEGAIDAIIGFWDFPISIMVPILAEQFGTTFPTLRSVVRCEHKYWSRVAQSEVIGQHVPSFTAINPFKDDPQSDLNLDYPVWLKPIKAYASMLGFKINNDQEFDRAINEIRGSIKEFAEPFNYVLSLVDLPENIQDITGYHCIAEQIMQGHQCTVAGYVHQGKVQTYGLISSLNYPDSSSFYRYQYPSELPEGVEQRLSDISERVMAHIGFDNSPFNIEYFYDEQADKILLLEINTRISQSHSYLFEKVDGASNHQVLVELALGHRPDFPRNEGKFKYASKFHVRAFEGETITHAPDEEQLRKLHEELPEAEVLPEGKAGMKLDDILGKDSYSYRLGVVYLGADDERELEEKYRRCLELIDYRVDGNKIRI